MEGDAAVSGGIVVAHGQHNGDSDMLRLMAVTASRYGFSSSMEKGILSIRVWDSVVVSTSGSAKIRLIFDNNNIIIRDDSLFSQKTYKIPADNPNLAVTVAYYLWLEKNRSLEAKIVKELVKAGRRSGPKWECPKIINTLPGLIYKEGMCHRLAALLGMGAYKLRLLLDIGVDDLLQTKPFFPPATGNKLLAASVESFASLVRTVMPGYENLEHALRVGESLYDRYRHVPSALKVDLVLASYIDRLSMPWRVYVAGLLLVGGGIRLVRKCRGLGLVDAALLGEASWVRSGDGMATCESGSPVSVGLSLAFYSRIGGTISVVSNARGSVKCASYSEPVCDQKSVVIDPGERAFRVLLSCVGTGDCTGKIVYVDKKPILLSIERPGYKPGELHLARLERGIRLPDVPLINSKVNWIRGRLQRRPDTRSLLNYSTARKLVEENVR